MEGCAIPPSLRSARKSAAAVGDPYPASGRVIACTTEGEARRADRSAMLLQERD